MRARPIRCGMVLLVACGAAPDPGAAIAEHFDARVAVTSDYVYRGISQTRGDPTLQGGIDFRHPSGFFAGVWGSGVDFPENRDGTESRTLEVDYFVGFELAVGGDWSGAVELVRYDYPGSGAGFDYAYDEIGVSAVYRERLRLAVAYSDDLFGFGRSSLHYELSGGRPLPRGLELVAGLGYADLDEVFGRRYAYWSLAVSRRVGRLEVELGWFDAGSGADRIWGDLAAGRLVLTLSAAAR